MLGNEEGEKERSQREKGLGMEGSSGREMRWGRGQGGED